MEPKVNRVERSLLPCAHPFMAVTPGSRIGPYDIIGTLGAGGMGEVYRARDAWLQRDVAIKVLPDAFAQDADRRARVRARGAHAGVAQPSSHCNGAWSRGSRRCVRAGHGTGRGTDSRHDDLVNTSSLPQDCPIIRSGRSLDARRRRANAMSSTETRLCLRFAFTTDAKYLARPQATTGRAQVFVDPECDDGYVVADVIRLDKGHSEVWSRMSPKKSSG
jgi:hypothetical protein